MMSSRNLLARSIRSHSKPSQPASAAVTASSFQGCLRCTSSSVQSVSQLHRQSSVSPQQLKARKFSTSSSKSALQELFDAPEASTSTSPTFTSTPTGLFGHYQLQHPSQLTELAICTLKTSRALLARLHATPSSGDLDELLLVVKNFDRLSDVMCGVIDLCELVRNVHPDDEWRDGCEAIYEVLCREMNELNTDVELYKTLKLVIDTPSIASRLSYSEIRTAEILLLDFEKSGILLNSSSRRSFVELSDHILQQSREFLSMSEPKERKAGLFRKSKKETKVDILEDILKTRFHLANVVGRRNFAVMSLEDKMAGSPENVSLFLENLHKSHLPNSLADVRTLSLLKQKHLNLPSPPKISQWDRETYSQMFLENSAVATLPPLSPFFSIGNVIQGLSELFKRLYGIEFVPSEVEPGEVWHPTVKKLQVRSDTEGLIGTIYFDLFHRQSKSPNPAHYTVRCSRRIDDDTHHKDVPFYASPEDAERAKHGILGVAGGGESMRGRPGKFQLPIVVLTTDFEMPSRGSGATCLEWEQVETLAHEMGHAIHSMIGRTEFQNVSGTRCATDFVELPSILMEHLISSPSVLNLFAKHHKTGKSLPYELFQAHKSIRSSFEALETHSQIMMAFLDQEYHGDLAGTGSDFDTTRILHRLVDEKGVIPLNKGNAWQTSFSHLLGYGATYYSYLFDRSIAHRVYIQLFEKDTLNRKNGEAFKEEVLTWGGGRDPWEAVGAVLKDDVVSKGGEGAMREVGKWGLGKS